MPWPNPAMNNSAAVLVPLPLADFTFTSPAVTYFESGVSSTLAAAAGWAFTRSTVGYGTNADGTLTSFAIDAPRVTDLGLLIEGAATNLTLWSQDITHWTQNDGANTVTANRSDPAGGTNAQTFQAGSAGAYIYNAGTLSGTGASSIWVRRRTGAGTVSMSTPANVSTPIAVTSSWQRFTRTSADAAGNGYIVITLAVSGDAVDIFGSQLETGSVPSSYIVTGTLTAARGADAATLTRAGAHFADVTYGGVTARPATPSPLDLGSASGGAWVGSTIQRVVVR